jgi:hypothetical protein
MHGQLIFEQRCQFNLERVSFSINAAGRVDNHMSLTSQCFQKLNQNESYINPTAKITKL